MIHDKITLALRLILITAFFGTTWHNYCFPGPGLGNTIMSATPLVASIIYILLGIGRSGGMGYGISGITTKFKKGIYYNRNSAHDQCTHELGHLEGQLYTQSWMSVCGISWRIPFTSRQVEREVTPDTIEYKGVIFVCRYGDCESCRSGISREQTSDEEYISCPKCRSDMGLAQN